MADRKAVAALLEAELGRKPYSWEIRSFATRHRKVPLNPVEPGHCRWCERPIIGKRGKYIGRPDPNRSWCREGEGRDCYREYRLHSDPQMQFWWLEANRGLMCAECGTLDPRRWRSSGPCSFSARPSPFWRDDKPEPLGWSMPPTPWEGERKGDAYIEAMIAHRDARLAECPEWNNATRIEYVSDLQVDHVVPLWKVAMMPIEQRRPYFGPEYLSLLCGPCHKRKTAEEAKERAAIKRAARLRLEP